MSAALQFLVLGFGMMLGLVFMFFVTYVLTPLLHGKRIARRINMNEKIAWLSAYFDVSRPESYDPSPVQEQLEIVKFLDLVDCTSAQALISIAWEASDMNMLPSINLFDEAMLRHRKRLIGDVLQVLQWQH